MIPDNLIRRLYKEHRATQNAGCFLLLNASNRGIVAKRVLELLARLDRAERRFDAAVLAIKQAGAKRHAR